MNTKALIFCSLIFCPSAWSASKQNAKMEVQERWKECTEIKTKKGTQKRRFVTPEEEEGDSKGTSGWIALSDKESKEKPEAELFFDSKKNLIYASIQEFAPSGDHNFVTEYCFRQNGSLAFLFRTFLTFQSDPAPVKEERRIWIDTDKKKIDQEIKVFNAKTNKALKSPSYNATMAAANLPSPIETFTAGELLKQFPK